MLGRSATEKISPQMVDKRGKVEAFIKRRCTQIIYPSGIFPYKPSISGYPLETSNGDFPATFECRMHPSGGKR